MLAGAIAGTLGLALALGPSPAAGTPFTAPDPGASPIFGGDEVPEGEWSAVVAIENGDFLCTGTMVAPGLALTAAHCLLGAPSPSSIVVTFGPTKAQPVAVTVAEDYGLHPDFCADTDVCKEDIHDFAWVRVTGSPNGIEIPPVMGTQEEWDDTMYADGTVTLVGYGLDEQGRLGTKRRVDTTISAFSSTGQEFRAGGDGKDSCQGDSGGPAFVQRADGTYVLAGITSRGFDCGEGGFYGIPYPILCWLNDETGVDLRRDDCGACDCLVMDPERHQGCCSVATPRPRGETVALTALVLGLFARRRRRWS